MAVESTLTHRPKAHGAQHDDGVKDSSLEYAKSLDAQDPLRSLRDEFIIPTKADLKRKRLAKDESEHDSPSESSIYLCGNSLGLQPRRTADYVKKYLDTWATKGVYGHFKELEDAFSPPWVQADDAAAEGMARIVGALPSEVAVMETLTANLHLLLASFYQPTRDRYKIIIEGKAFPSDQYAVQSQILHHGFKLSDALVEVNPPSSKSPYLPTSHILSVIESHASSTAVLLLSGVQYYSGQYFDIPKITAFAQSRGITVGWDLAHAAGNVPLQLHDWNVDFAAWCTYKYLNSGAGAIAALFVHERHGNVTEEDSASNDAENDGTGALNFRPRLSGWWGNDKASRFRMESRFVPRPGAAGFQVSNPSALDTAAVLGSLSVFQQTDVEKLRAKSLRLTKYLEDMLGQWPEEDNDTAVSPKKPYEIITPLDPKERGAQLSVRLQPGLLNKVMEVLEDNGVVVDERRPDVVRVAPAPLYNSFEDVWRFVHIFRDACKIALDARKDGGEPNGVGSDQVTNGV